MTVQISPPRKLSGVCETSDQIKFYFKLPNWFKIPTPIGNYNPDWAVVFKDDKKIYFVAETKGSMLDADLKAREKSKIESAKKFFATLNQENQPLGDAVQYSVIDSFGSLMKLVK